MLTKKKMDSVVPAGTTMLAKLKDDVSKLTLSNTAELTLAGNAAPESKPMEVVDWDGKSGLMEDNLDFTVTRGSSFHSTTAEGADGVRYTFNADGTFGPNSCDVITPFRMFLDLKSLSGATTPARYSISISVTDDTTTGVKKILSQPPAADAVKTSIYAIDGRRVNDADKLTKGIYIKDGKKVIVK